MSNLRMAFASAMWRVLTRRRKTCRRSWIIWKTPQSTGRSAPPCRRASCLSALRARARPCWPRPWPVRQTSPSSPCPARNLWRCSWAWAPPRCGICFDRPRRRLPASSLSMRSTPSARSEAAVSTAAMMSENRPSISCSQRWTALTGATA